LHGDLPSKNRGDLFEKRKGRFFYKESGKEAEKEEKKKIAEVFSARVDAVRTHLQELRAAVST